MTEFGIFMIMFTALAAVTQIHIYLRDLEESDAEDRD